MKNLILLFICTICVIGLDGNLNAENSPIDYSSSKKESKVEESIPLVGSNTVTSYAGGGFVFGDGNTWAGANSAAGAPNGVGAESLVFAGNTSAYLLVKDFNFNIPCNATIESITIDITRRNEAPNPVDALDATVSLFNPNTLSVSTFNNADPNVWLQSTTSWETITYTDMTWGETLTPELINNERFGLVIESTNASAFGRIESNVDAVLMTVCYAISSPPSTAIDFDVTTVNACFDEGQIIIDATGGEGTYEYTIDTGMNWQSSNTFSNLPIGTYTVGVRNASNNTCQTEFRFISLSGDERVIQPGDALVTCATYPGNSVTVAIEKMQSSYDLFSMGETGYDISPLIANHPYEWTVAQLGGEVFSTAIDTFRNIYTATSALYDITPGAAVPLIISKIDAVDASVTQIANIPSTVGGAGIEYDTVCNQIYVANLDDGTIYRLDPDTGTTLETFDPLVADNGSPSFAPLGERVMAVTKNNGNGRLYYSMWNSDFNRTGIRNTIRSVAIDPTTCEILEATDRLEFDLPWTQEYGDPLRAEIFSMPVADIEFSQDWQTMIMGESGFDSSGPVARAHESRMLRYIFNGATWDLQTTVPAGNLYLQHELGEFSQGLNARGGVAFANSGFDGSLCAIDADAFVMATSDALRGADCNSLGCYYGLQYLPIDGGNPLGSILLDIGRDPSSQQKGIFGDVDILKGCLAGIYCCPDVTTAEPDVTICPGDPVNDLIFDTQSDSLVLVYHTTIPADSIEVYANGIPIDSALVISNQATLSMADLPLGTPGVYYVYAISHPLPLSESCRPYDSLIVNVRTLPTVNITDPADQCVDGANMSFTGTPAPGAGTSGVFSTTALAGLTDNNDGTAILNVAAATPGTYDVTYTYTDAFGCINSATSSVTIYDIPTVGLNDPADVCVDGSDLNYTGSPLPVVGTSGMFTTTAPGGLTDNGDGTAVLDIDVAGVGTYDVTYTYTDAQGCDNSITNSVTIFALPVVTINDPADECLVGSLMNFSGTPVPGAGTSGVFTTTALAGLVDNADGTATLDPDAAGPGIHDMTYTFTDINGCQDFATSSVEVFDTLPNVITSNTSICGNPLFGTNVIDLNTTIVSGPLTGTWADTDASGGLSGSTFTATPAMEGSSYDFTYTLTGPGPVGTSCQTRSFVVTIDVVYCNLDVALIKNTSVTTPVDLNQVVTFDYTICNQGFTIVDSIEITDYVPPCYGFTPNNGWVASGSDAVRTLTIANGGIPSGGIPTPASAPANCITISLDLTVICGTPADLINYAEITAHRDTAGNTEDIDSSPGSDNGLERSVLPGDPNDDSFTDINEDDHDPADVPLVDVALRMTTSEIPPFNYGDQIDFIIEVINQGNVDLANVQISDYIPCGYMYDPINDGTWAEAGGIATTTIPSLDEGENTFITITLVLLERGPTCGFDIAWNNEAEVSLMFDDLGNNVSLEDFDSVANGVLGDDAGGAPNTPSDDAIDGDGSGLINGIVAATDEDDHDPMELEFYDLQLTKLETSVGPYGQDSMVTYAIQIENQGSLPAANIVVEDIPELGLNYVSSDAGLNPNVNETGVGEWTVLALAPDGTETINVTYIVSNTYQGLMLSNFAQITSDDGDDLDSDPNSDETTDEDGDGDPDDDDEDFVTIDLVQFYDLTLSKTEVSTGPYAQGDLITYEITVLNEGTLNASNISILDSPDPGLDFVSDNSGSLANVSSPNPMEYLINTLDFTDSQAVQLTFRVNASYQGFTITNSAQIIADDGDDRDSDPNTGPTVDEDGDLDGDDDDEDAITLDVEQIYDLALAKTEVSAGPYVQGSLITYSISVTNEGSLHAYNVEFEDVAGVGLTFVSDSYGANVTEVSPQRYQINTLNFGTTETVNLTYQVDPLYQGFDVTNNAQILVDDGDDQDSDPNTDETVDEDGDLDGDDDDEDVLVLDIDQTYDLEITKTLLTPDPIFPGDDVTFLITVNNTGSLNATNIEITESPDPNFTFISSNAGANANIIVVTDDIYTIIDLPFNTSESFEITYNIPLTYLIQNIRNDVEITVDDGDDQDSDPDFSNDVDEDGDGDTYDDDEAFSDVPVIIGYDLGDYVWHDLDGDGIQEGGEPGLEGWTVTLYNHLGFIVDVTQTDASGYYLFEEVYPANYYIGLTLQ
ncbi:MAG: DUF11 domain-containing protein, partial [Saprospiraceae bacterium]|nr:DUF11 domain-containing protein [Saprospiraceae bacterium]